MNFYYKPNLMSSRTLQNYQHFIGGFYQIILTVMGVSFGQEKIEQGYALAMLAFIFSRLSVELTFQVQKAVMRERHDL